MNSKEAWKDERNLDDEIPFAYDEGEFSCPCSYIEDCTVWEIQTNNSNTCDDSEYNVFYVQ